MMIIEYQRPNTIPEALSLLKRKDPPTYPMGGGTYLNRPTDVQFAVIDLQALGLGEISREGNHLSVGATVTLQKLVEFQGLPEELYKATKLEATYNLRQMATIVGTLVTATGRSSLTTMLFSMDTALEVLELDQNPVQVKLGDWLPKRGYRQLDGLISRIIFPFNIKVAYESISRTPGDLPIVCAAVCQWPSGRTRLVMGGYGRAPMLAMDGPEASGLEIAARNAYSRAGDEWASEEYRSEMAGIIALRCLERIR